MAKKVKAVIKLQIPAGEATPAPPVGTALGPYGINIMAFVKEYNSRTANDKGTIIPVEILVFEDTSFTFITKTPPASMLLKKALSLEKGSGSAGVQEVGVVSREQARVIAEAKMKDLNASDIDAAMRIIEGTATSMGIRVEDKGT